MQGQEGEFHRFLVAPVVSRLRTVDMNDTTNCGLYLTLPGTAFGDIALVPAPWMKHPKGIRGVEEWYMATVMNRDYVQKVFECRLESALKNLMSQGDLLRWFPIPPAKP